MSNLSKAFLFTWLVSGIVLLVGINQVFLGSALAILRWPLILLGGLLWWQRPVWRKQRLFGAVMIVMGLWLGESLYRGFRYMNWSSYESTGVELTISTYNVFFKNGYKQNIIQEIREEDPDIVILQEYTSSWQTALSASLFKRYPHRHLNPRKGPYGGAILSKYPIVEKDQILVGEYKVIAQITELNVRGKPLHLINVHLSSPAAAVEKPQKFFSYFLANYKVRKSQWTRLQTVLSDIPDDEAIIIGGDFNTMRWEPLYRDIRFDYQDLFRKEGSGWRATFPNVSSVPFPLITLDYLMYKGAIKGNKARVLSGSSADHLGVWGKFEM